MRSILTSISLFVSMTLFAQSEQKDYYHIFRCDTVHSEIVEEYFITQMAKYLDVEFLSIEFSPNSLYKIEMVEYIKKGSTIKYRSTIEFAEYFLLSRD